MATQEAFAPRGLWHVDWLGRVERAHDSTEPTVEVLVSLVDEGKLTTSRRPGSARIPDTQRWTLMGVGRLPEIYVGALFRDNRRVDAAAHYESWQPQGVVFSLDTIHFVESGKELAKNRFLVPPFVADLGASGMGTLCMTVQTSGGEMLVVPCMEVLRYYYASSTHMVRTLVAYPFEEAEKQLYSREVSGVHEDGTIVLRLRKKSRDADAARLALIYLSKYAQEAARGIHDSVMEAHVPEMYRRATFVSPKVIPPVCGPVDLEVEGVWIKEPAPRRFLVFRIKRGTLWPSDLEMSEIGLERDNDSRPGEDSRSELRPAWRGAAKAIAFEYGDIVPGSDPTTTAEEETWYIEPDDPDWSALPTIRKLDKDEVKYRAESLRRGVSAIEDLSTGEARGQHEATRPLSVSRSESPPASESPAGFKFVRDVTTELKNMLTCVMSEIRADRDGQPASPPGSPISLLQRTRGRGPQRRALVTRVDLRGWAFYVLDLERPRVDKGASVVVMHRSLGEAASGRELRRTLGICADTGTWFGGKQTIAYVEFRRFPRGKRTRGATHAQLARRMAVRIAAHLKATVSRGNRST